MRLGHKPEKKPKESGFRYVVPKENRFVAYFGFLYVKREENRCLYKQINEIERKTSMRWGLEIKEMSWLLKENRGNKIFGSKNWISFLLREWSYLDFTWSKLVYQVYHGSDVRTQVFFTYFFSCMIAVRQANPWAHESKDDLLHRSYIASELA